MFPIKQRVPREIIEKVISEGEKSYSELFLLKKLKNDLEYDRFAVLVSKKVDKSAVGRHLIKRRYLNIVRDILKGGDGDIKHDFVIIVSSKNKDFKYESIKKEIDSKKDFLL